MGTRRRLDGFVILYAVTALAAIGLACLFYSSGVQDLCYDARHYYKLSSDIARSGLFSFANELRTYGYPLFLASCRLISTRDPSVFRFVVFTVQLAAYLATCFYAARVLREVFGSRRLAGLVFLGAALNPFLLIRTTEVLTELLSSVFIFLSFLLILKREPQPESQTASAGPTKYGSDSTRAFLSFLCLGLAMMIRPANAVLLLPVVLLWAFRMVAFRAPGLRAVPLMVAGLALPLVPQLVNNYRAYGALEPLIITKLYQHQLQIGMEHLKYGTVRIPGEEPRLFYANPLYRPVATSPWEYMKKKPLRYLGTLGLHAFAMFDQDYPHTYITDLRPWQRWPLSAANYAFLFLCAAGLWHAVRQAWRNKRLDPVLFSVAGALLMSAVYVAAYLPTLVENRFSMPVYLLLVPLFALGLNGVYQHLRERRWRLLAGQAIALTAFMLGCAAASAWVQQQAPRLALAEPSSGFCYVGGDTPDAAR